MRHRRSEERRFQAYSEFLTGVRSCRNAVQAYYLQSDNGPSTEELDVVLQAANDASALVFLVAESEETYQGCVAALGALWKARVMIHELDASGAGGSWAELHADFGRSMREFQNAVRHELQVSGPAHPWVISDASANADIREHELNTPGQQLEPSAMDD